MVRNGTFIKLNPRKRPGSYLARSHPSDVARVEDRTFICSESQGGGRPDQPLGGSVRDEENHARAVQGLHAGPHDVCHPLRHGAAGFPALQNRRGNLRFALCRGQHAHHDPHGQESFGQARRERQFHSLHALGGRAPCSRDKRMSPGRASPTPRKNTSCIFRTSRPSGPTVRATAATRCWARNVSRCASPPCVAKREGWMAEHMLILCLTSPAGKKYYLAAAFPSACGKTNLAMMQPTLPGWKVTTLGDDIAWIRVGKDGRLYAMNPETGFFGVAPGHLGQFQSARAGRVRQEHHLHQRRADPRRRRLVGRHGRARAGPGH